MPQQPTPDRPSSRNSVLSTVLGGFGLIAGATYPVRAIATFIHNPKLRPYVSIPIAVNVVVGIALYVGLLLPGLNGIDATIARVGTYLEAFVARLPAWLGFLNAIDNLLGWGLRLVLVGLLLVAIGLLLVQFGAILGAPWYGQLSEQLELLRNGKLPIAEPMTLKTIARDIWRALMFEIKKLVFAAGFALILLLFNGVPLIGTIAASVGGIAIAATIVCLDFLDAPLERRRLRFRRKLGIVFGHLPASGSFALVCLVMISIPMLNLLAVPVCVAAGTLFFCDRVWPKFGEEVRE
ncbi:MAG: hypothetical protein D6680_06520 [Cyanobacteria bacterium J007]|jgi:CysZ protein|nr:MAG: hypothetical protein D6680_06520 [Cyanobacteria bacterium J007]